MGSFFPAIRAALRWAQGTVDISYQFANRDNATEWVRRGFGIWQQWRDRSQELLTRQVSHVLFLDVANFYENIDIRTLISDLRQLGTDDEARDLLQASLYRWADTRARGVPQGYTAADILAKLYLHPIDQTLRNENFNYIRYVDDIRVFCTSELDAKRALKRITELLRRRGLNIHSTKTRIATAADALAEIDGVTPVIEQIAGEIVEEYQEMNNAGYATLADLERIANANPENVPREVLEATFRDFFVAGNREFDKTLLHFVLTRLRAIRSDVAVDYSLNQLRERPWETDAFLRYLEVFELDDAQVASIFDYLESADCIYSYQPYAVLRHFHEVRQYPERCIAFARAVLRDGNQPIFAKSYAVAIIAAAGDAGDIENLQGLYAGALDPVFRATLICGTQRLERNRRNGWYGIVRNDGDWQRRAIEWVQNQN
jgi:hypothetical protein